MIRNADAPPPRKRFAPCHWGFSLDEAAAIRRQMLDDRDPVICPRCDGVLSVLAAGPTLEDLTLVTCGDCGVSLMVSSLPPIPVRPLVTGANTMAEVR
jgi:hypothetical protein